MSLLFTNNEILYGTDNQPTMFGTIYRRNRSTGSIDAVYGPKAANVKPNGGGEESLARLIISGDKGATHSILLDYDVPEDGSDPFIPLLDSDVVYIKGSRGKVYDGYYSLVRYALPEITLTPQMDSGNLDALALDCRFTGAKRAGDAFGQDNTGNIRTGGSAR